MLSNTISNLLSAIIVSFIYINVYYLSYTFLLLKKLINNHFLGAKAPLGLARLINRLSDKKFRKCKISQDLNSKQYTMISYSPLWTFARLRVSTARDGHLPSLGWSTTNPRTRLDTHQIEVNYWSLLHSWNLARGVYSII